MSEVRFSREAHFSWLMPDVSSGDASVTWESTFPVDLAVVLTSEADDLDESKAVEDANAGKNGLADGAKDGVAAPLEPATGQAELVDAVVDESDVRELAANVLGSVEHDGLIRELAVTNSLHGATVTEDVGARAANPSIEPRPAGETPKPGISNWGG